MTRIWVSILALCLPFLAACRGSEKKETDSIVRVVSWGGQFQRDLLRYWIEPSAKMCSIKTESTSWDGDYGGLTTRIVRGTNTWDLVHVEAHYVSNPQASDLFHPFKDR